MVGATSTINIKMDSEIKEWAKRVFDRRGAGHVHDYQPVPRQAVHTNGIPFPFKNGCKVGYVGSAFVYRATVTDAGVVVPADWDDTEDAVYDKRYTE